MPIIESVEADIDEAATFGRSLIARGQARAMILRDVWLSRFQLRRQDMHCRIVHPSLPCCRTIGENDVPDVGIADALDQILQSSLWEHRLSRRPSKPDMF